MRAADSRRAKGRLSWPDVQRIYEDLRICLTRAQLCQPEIKDSGVRHANYAIVATLRCIHQAQPGQQQACQEAVRWACQRGRV